MCDICIKENDNEGLSLIPLFIKTLDLFKKNPSKFKDAVIKRYTQYNEYKGAWPDSFIEPKDILAVVKNHFPIEYEKYGIDKLVVLL